MNYMLAAICLLVLGASTWTAALEFQPFVSGRGDAARLATVANGAAATGPSIGIGRNSAEECLWAISSPAGILQPKAARLQTLDACAVVSERLRHEHPALSAGYLLAATIAAQRSDGAALSDMLARSREVAPQSQAMARIRANLAAMNYDKLSDRGRDAERNDLTLLLTSQAGIEYLAARYIADEALRDRVRPLLDSVPAAYRDRFVSMLGHLTESAN